MAKKDEKNWWEEFAYMTPAEQEWVMAEHGLPFTPPVTYAEEGEDEFPIPQIAGMPEFTSKGALDPMDLTQFNKQIDTSKDYAGLLVDNVLSMLSGGGAYNSDAFTPTMEYGKEVTQPGSERLAQTANRGGWEGYVASKMLYENMTPSQAMGALQDFVEAIDPEDPEADPQAKALLQSLPRYKRESGPEPPGAEPKTFWETYDYDRVFNTASELQNAVFEDDMPGWVDPDTGRMYEAKPEEIKTPQMEWYDKYGLPYPTASYTDPEYLEGSLNRAEGTTPEQREAEVSAYEPLYGQAAEQTQKMEALQRAQMSIEGELAKAWNEILPQDNRQPLDTRPATTTAPGSAGVEYGRQRGASPTAPGAATMRGTSQQATLPTTVLQPGRQMVPLAGLGNPATGAKAGRTWAYTGNGNLFAEPPPQPKAAPMVRTLASGLTGLVGGGFAPQPNQGQGFGVLAPGEMAKDPMFSAFTAPKGSKTRQMKESDVSPTARWKRFEESEKRAGRARTQQRQVEAADPRLNDIETYARLWAAMQSGRTPLQDALAGRRAGLSQIGF
jgi:hypothetical protein